MAAVRIRLPKCVVDVATKGLFGANEVGSAAHDVGWKEETKYLAAMLGSSGKWMVTDGQVTQTPLPHILDIFSVSGLGLCW